MFTSVQYAGHSAVLVFAGEEVAAIDPWLRTNPTTPESLKKLERLDLMILSHGHSDHAGEAVEIHKETGCLIAAGFELGDILMEEGVPEEKVVSMNPGGLAPAGSFTVAFTFANHSNSYDSPARGRLYAGVASGIILKHEEDCLYHAGDTSLFGDMALIGQVYQPTLGLFPVGGVYTMDGAEAARAAKLTGVRQAIPIHYKTFPGLAQNADAFLAGCQAAGIEGIELAPGETYPFHADRL